MQRNVDSRIYEFKGFRLEAGQRRLLYQGQPVPLKPKILDLLLFLVEMRGQLVVKEDLMREIWPDSIVEENNITVSMSILRKTLGDNQLTHQFIETVPRRGYRFLAEVTEVPAEHAAASVARRPDTQTESQDETIDSLAVLPLQMPVAIRTSNTCRKVSLRASSTCSRAFRSCGYLRAAPCFASKAKILTRKQLGFNST